MKANELMIGDWVDIKATHSYIYKRRKITANDLIDSIHTECVYIPLTAEILEKNGIKWLSTEPSGRTTYISIEPPIMATWLKDHWLVSVGPAGSTKMPYVEIGWLNYVHQLQHALRLCGITHEISL
jgi:hypothetical protein